MPWYEVTLSEARRDALRNKLFQTGHPVDKMRRVGMGNLKLEGLESGRHREVSAAEIATLIRLLDGKETAPADRPPKRPAKPPKFAKFAKFAKSTKFTRPTRSAKSAKSARSGQFTKHKQTGRRKEVSSPLLAPAVSLLGNKFPPNSDWDLSPVAI